MVQMNAGRMVLDVSGITYKARRNAFSLHTSEGRKRHESHDDINTVFYSQKKAQIKKEEWEVIHKFKE